MSVSKQAVDYGTAHTRTASPGQDSTRRRGEIAVYNDGSTYFYHRAYLRSVSDFKSWVYAAFAKNYRDIRITGQFPNYSVE